MGVTFRSYLVEKNIEYLNSNQDDSLLVENAVPENNDSPPKEEKDFWMWLREAQHYSASMELN